MLFLIGLLLIIGAFIFMMCTIDSYSDAPMYIGICGVIVGILLFCYGEAKLDAEIAQEDCANFRKEGTEAYLVQNSCYVKVAENVFTETRGESKDIRPRSWVIGHKYPGQ